MYKKMARRRFRVVCPLSLNAAAQTVGPDAGPPGLGRKRETRYLDIVDVRETKADG